MSFTDRYIKLPIQIYDRKHAEITGQEVGEDSWMKVNPMEIASYRPTYDKDDIEKKEIVSITTKQGDSTNVYLSPEEFEELLNSFNRC